MTDSPFVPIEEVMHAMDLPKRAVFNDIRAGRIPGELRYGQPLIRRYEWNQYLRGEWRPGSARKQIGIHSLGSAKAS